MKNLPIGLLTLGLALAIASDEVSAAPGRSNDRATDPGVRSGSSAGGALRGLTSSEHALFEAGREAFMEADGVGDGLGPRFNLDSCAGCHSQPAIGGTAPAVNPQVTIGTSLGARNKIPVFVRRNGPVVEARFKKAPDGSTDGGVHSLFVISGRIDQTGNATRCGAVQDDFDGEYKKDNVALRIPTPAFGSGLIEAIADGTILANLRADHAVKARLGISGRPNRNPNTGTIARLGWKAQNASLLLFSGEAYNVESGISNELFQTERDDTPSCQFAPVPNDSSALGAAGEAGAAAVNDIELFAFFMKFLAPPLPSRDLPGGDSSITRGRRIFDNVGCTFCHTPSLQTSTYGGIEALRKKTAWLYSDLALHNMGPKLADDITQGDAAGDEFRTAPLWGLGQRIFLLHDGRTTDLVEAIYAHRSNGNSHYGPSEANQVVGNFQSLPDPKQQDLLNFLRSL